jgi:5-methylcytosine-specific restriction enzyme subunit McrC
MLTYAYDLADFYDHAEYESIQELFEYLIEIFQKKILKLAKQGLFANYVQFNESLSYLKGRLDLPTHLKNAWRRDKLDCEYNEFSVDILENQIIRFTLDKLLCMHYEKHHIRQGLVTTKRYFDSIIPCAIFQKDFNAIQYHVLNQHYRPIHQFCKMIFDLIGIHEQMGDASFNAYSVDMNVLFEQYIGKLLQENLTSHKVDLQKHFYFDDERELAGRPDIVIYQNRVPRLVLDTKYKVHDSLSMNDVNQMHHYMDRLGVDGVLIYPDYSMVERTHTFGQRRLFVKTIRLDDIRGGAKEFMAWVRSLLQENVVSEFI